MTATIRKMVKTDAARQARKLGMRGAFVEWLESNAEIWEGFRALADKMRARGRGVWSSKAVIEVLRWNSALREAAGVFKINNNLAPDLARLYNATTGDAFFRERAKSA